MRRRPGEFSFPGRKCKERGPHGIVIPWGADRLGTSAIVKLVKGQTPQGY